MLDACHQPAPRAGDGLSHYLRRIRQAPWLDPVEERDLAARWRLHEDRAAFDRLVTTHLRMVVTIAMRFRGYGLPLADLIAEGNVGLMDAVRKFDPDRGFRLSTFAVWCIRAEITAFVLRSWSLVKIGTTSQQKKLFFGLRRAKAQLSALGQGRSASGSGAGHRPRPRRAGAGRGGHGSTAEGRRLPQCIAQPRRPDRRAGPLGR